MTSSWPSGSAVGAPAMKTADYSQSIEFGNAATYRIVVKGVLDTLYGLHLPVISVKNVGGD